MSDKNFDDAIRWFQRSKLTGRFVSKDFVKEQAENVIFAIRTRTQEGKDVNLGNFAPYSHFYAEWKGSDNVDLTLTGKMLDDLDYRIGNSRTVIYFRTVESEDKARVLNYGAEMGYFQLPPREFFAVSDAEVEIIVDDLEELIDVRLPT